MIFRGCIAALIGICGATGLASAESIFEGAPPAPEGYENYRAAQFAVLSGKVARVEAPGEVPEGIAFHDDVVYAEPGGEALSLDIYVPKDADSPPPVVLFIHGGGWSKGKKEDLALYTIRFAKLGYATASMQYRLSPKHHFPAAIQDVECALAWLKAHGGDYGFDGSRTVVMGGSAGGHLALLAGYSDDKALACPDAESMPAVKGIVNLYGVVDCTTKTAQEARQVQDFIGASYEDAAQMYAKSSPIEHLDKNDPPTLTFHGTIDELVPVSQADRLHEKLDELGVANYYDRVEGWPHSMDLAKPLSERFCYIIENFLEKYLPLKP